MLQVLFALRHHVSSQRGAAMVEYGILVALIAVVAIAVVTALGLDVFAAFDNAQTEIPPPSAPIPSS